MPNVNPDMLRWARETASLSPEDAVKQLHIKDARGMSAKDRLVALETGNDLPSESMLHKINHRPLLAFYLRQIPPKGDRGEDFRKLPESVDRIQEGLVDTVVRKISRCVKGSFAPA